KRRKSISILRLRAKADDGRGAPVEVPCADNDLCLTIRHALDLIAPFAYQLDGGLDCLRASVHGQNFFIASQVAEFPIKRPKLVIAEGPRGQRNAPRLFEHSLLNLRVSMSLVDGGIGT